MFRLALLLGFAVACGLFGLTFWKTRQIEARYPPRGAFAGKPGARIHFIDLPAIGALRGVVLAIHGASGTAADMNFALGPRLAARGFRVIAVDRPGQGWSDRPDGAADASPARQAQLICAAMDGIGVREAIVLGHSLGGAVAINFALDQRDFTAGLVLVSPVSHPWPGGVAWYYNVAATPVLGEMFARLIALPVGLSRLKDGVAAVFAPQPTPAGYASATGVALALRPEAFIANAQDVAGLHAFVTLQAPRMTAIAAPTAIVTGDSDGVVLKRIHSDGSARAIPGATLTVLPGVGHAPHNSDPDAVVKAVEEVAARIEAAARAPAAAM